MILMPPSFSERSQKNKMSESALPGWGACRYELCQTSSHRCQNYMCLNHCRIRCGEWDHNRPVFWNSNISESWCQCKGTISGTSTHSPTYCYAKGNSRPLVDKWETELEPEFGKVEEDAEWASMEVSKYVDQTWLKSGDER